MSASPALKRRLSCLPKQAGSITKQKDKKKKNDMPRKPTMMDRHTKIVRNTAITEKESAKTISTCRTQASGQCGWIGLCHQCTHTGRSDPSAACRWTTANQSDHGIMWEEGRPFWNKTQPELKLMETDRIIFIFILNAKMLILEELREGRPFGNSTQPELNLKSMGTDYIKQAGLSRATLEISFEFSNNFPLKLISHIV